MNQAEELQRAIEQTHADLVNLRDNHVHHLALDLADMKTDIAVIKEKVGGLENFKQELVKTFRPYLQAALVVALSTFGFVSQM